MNETKSLGQIAYEAHAVADGYRLMTQRSWEHVHQPHWNIVATAVADEVRKECAAEMEKLRRHRSAAMLANAELAKERAECERLRKERDAAHAALSERAKKDAELFAPTTDVKEPGQRAFEAYMSFAVYGAKWASTTDGGTWAHVERTIEAPLLDEIAAVKKRCAQIDNDLRDKIILYIEALRERDKARAEVERLRAEIANRLPVDDEPSVPPEHELPVACGTWKPTPQIRWLRINHPPMFNTPEGRCGTEAYRLQQLWRCDACDVEEWRNVEVV